MCTQNKTNPISENLDMTCAQVASYTCVCVWGGDGGGVRAINNPHIIASGIVR